VPYYLVDLFQKQYFNLFCFRLVILAGGYTVELFEEGREGGGAGKVTIG